MTGLALAVLLPAVATAAECPPLIEKRSSPCTPSADEKARLREEIQAALDAEAAFQKARRLEEGERAALRRLSDPSERDQALERWDQARAGAKILHDSAAKKMQEVADRVQRSYGIPVPDGERKIANGPFAGAKVSWSVLVQVDRDDAIRREVTPSGEARYLRFPKDTDPNERIAALTADDGQVRLGLAAFQNARDIDPGLLALTIRHEAVHFEQLTGRGWSTRASVESQAYAEQLSLLGKVGVPAAYWKNTIFRAITWNFVLLGETHSGFRTPAPFTPDGDDTRNGADFEGALADIKREQTSLAHEIERRAQERRARETRESLAESRRQQARQDADRQARETLALWAKAACEDPVWYSSWGLDRLTHLFSALVVPSNVFDLSLLPSRVACADYILNQVLVQKAKAENADWLFFSGLPDRWRKEADRHARRTLVTWAENQCTHGSLPDSLTGAEVKQAYLDVLIDGPFENLWERPYYTGIPCPALFINMIMLDKKHQKPFREWEDWESVTRIAAERSRSSAPQAPGSDPSNQPPAPPSGVDDTDDEGPVTPQIPHCRFHPWCQDKEKR